MEVIVTEKIVRRGIKKLNQNSEEIKKLKKDYNQNEWIGSDKLHDGTLF